MDHSLVKQEKMGAALQGSLTQIVTTKLHVSVVCQW